MLFGELSQKLIQRLKKFDAIDARHTAKMARPRRQRQPAEQHAETHVARENAADATRDRLRCWARRLQRIDLESRQARRRHRLLRFIAKNDKPATTLLADGGLKRSQEAAIHGEIRGIR